MRRRLLALLIVCVTMLTQIAAPMAGVASTGSGSVAIGVWCKAQALLTKRFSRAQQSERATPAQSAAQDDLAKDSNSEDLPSSHRDHASCGFCEVSVDATPVGWVAPKARVVEIYEKLSFDLSGEVLQQFELNRSALARGPPAFI
jgi:hypothetical protein